MHWLRLVLFHIVPLILAVAAPVLLLWAWGNGLPLLPALLVGLLFLSAAVVVHLVGTLHHSPDAQAVNALWAELAQLRDQVRRLSQNQPAAHDGATQQVQDSGPGAEQEQATLAESVEHIAKDSGREQGAPRPSPATSGLPDTGAGEPSSGGASAGGASASTTLVGAARTDTARDGVAHAAQHFRRAVASANTYANAKTGAPIAGADIAHAAMPRSGTLSAGLPAAPQGYALYMESVHEAASGETVFYRAMPALPAEERRIYPGRHAQLRARLLGQAGGLQLHTLRDSLTFLRELRAMHGTLPVACPLDAATLAHGPAAETILQTVCAAGSLAREGLLLVVEMDDLGVISREAHAGLVALSDLVAGWVLDCGHLPQGDATLPLPLQVRHVDVPVAGLELMTGLSDGMERLRALSARGWRVVARDVQTEVQLTLARQLGVLARGGLLAAPRRVRLGADAAAAGRAAAAEMPEGNGENLVPKRAVGMG